MPKPKQTFSCRECGSILPRWMGKCPDCGAWNTFVEERITPATDTEAEIPAGLMP